MGRMTPVNLSVADVHAAAGMGSEAKMPAVPDAGDLDNWAQEAYSLDVSAAANLGFPVGSISAGAQRDALMLGSLRMAQLVSVMGVMLAVVGVPLLLRRARSA